MHGGFAIRWLGSSKVTTSSQLNSELETSRFDGSHRVPLYHQIYLILRDEVLSGARRVGDLLPSEHELVRSYNVSRITAKRALTELATAGLAHRARGRGTIVAFKPDYPPLRASVANWLKSVEAMGRSTVVDVIKFGYGGANEEEARALDIDPGDEVQRSLRARRLAEGRFSLLSTVLPGALGRTFNRRELASIPLLELMRRAGVEATRAQQVITATLANQTVARHMDTEVGAALLKVQRIVFDEDGRPVEYLTALYRPDRYQLELELTPEHAVDLGTLGELRKTKRDSKKASSKKTKRRSK